MLLLGLGAVLLLSALPGTLREKEKESFTKTESQHKIWDHKHFVMQMECSTSNKKTRLVMTTINAQNWESSTYHVDYFTHEMMKQIVYKWFKQRRVRDRNCTRKKLESNRSTQWKMNGR